MSGISPKLPLSIDSTDGYALIKTYVNMVKQNLKMLILTIPGERIMDPEFGVGLRKYLFELDSTFPYPIVETKIREQIKRYLPYIDVRSVKFSNFSKDRTAIVNNSIRVQLNYRIIPLEAFDSVEISDSV